MRSSKPVFLLLLVLSVFVAAGCAGGPDDPQKSLAAACERQIEEIADAKQESKIETAKSSEEHEASEQLHECAGQKPFTAAAAETTGDADGGDAAEGDAAAGDAPAGDTTAAAATTDDATGGPQTLELKVAPGTFKFDTEELEAKAGTVTMVLTNTESIQHNIALKDADGNVVQEGELVGDAGTSTITMDDLKPGTYTYYCTPHEAIGMVGTLTVT